MNNYIVQLLNYLLITCFIMFVFTTNTTWLWASAITVTILGITYGLLIQHVLKKRAQEQLNEQSIKEKEFQKI